MASRHANPPFSPVVYIAEDKDKGVEDNKEKTNPLTRRKRIGKTVLDIPHSRILPS